MEEVEPPAELSAVFSSIHPSTYTNLSKKTDSHGLKFQQIASSSDQFRMAKALCESKDSAKHVKLKDQKKNDLKGDKIPVVAKVPGKREPVGAIVPVKVLGSSSDGTCKKSNIVKRPGPHLNSTNFDMGDRMMMTKEEYLLGGGWDRSYKRLKTGSTKELLRQDNGARSIAIKQSSDVANSAEAQLIGIQHIVPFETTSGKNVEDPLSSLRPDASVPTMLVLKFPPKAILPSFSELIEIFARFGSLDISATRMFCNSSICRIVFLNKPDAEAAYRHALKGTLFGNTKVCYCMCDVEDEAPALPELGGSEKDFVEKAPSASPPHILYGSHTSYMNSIDHNADAVNMKYCQIESTNSHNWETASATTTCVDISSQMMDLLKRCSEIMAPFRNVPYHVLPGL